jgi:LuxR family transcriptional regulator, maltose regulon positive regulatory protein
MYELDIDPSLALKLTPPRIRRTAAPRAWCMRHFDRLRDRAIGVVQAPGGFGKTTLLAEWRRELLASGVSAGWLLCDRRDENERFIAGIAASLRAATGIARLGVTATQAAKQPSGELDAMTALLADVIEVARPIALLLDDAHELPDATSRVLLPYLLHNLPANLQLFVVTRQRLRSKTAELAVRSDFVSLGAGDLRLRLDETIEFLRSYLSDALDVDACAHVHEITDGWPIALQLAASALEREPTRKVAAISGSSRDIGRFFHDTVLKRLPPREADFVVACSILDVLHPDLCHAMTEVDDAAALLERLERTTPMFSATENSEWLRMHPLARSAFAGQFAALPGPERLELHWRAAQWLRTQDDIEAAARHALAAGRSAIAYSWIGEHLYDIALAGHIAAVLAWVDRLPPDVLALEQVRRAAAWAQTLSYEPVAAERNLCALHASADAAVRYEADLIQAALAVYADDLDRVETLTRPWEEAPPTADSTLRQIHTNLTSYVLLDRGEPERVRYQQALARADTSAEALTLPTIHGDFAVGMSYLNEARPRLAEQTIRPALQRVEAVVGRRGMSACVLAPVLAAACWDQDRREDAEATLAYRADVIERIGIPEMITLAYVVLARAAFYGGQELRALDLLARLYSLGEDRALTRLSVTSLAEQIRIHAGQRRPDMCSILLEQMDACFANARSNGEARTDSFWHLVRVIARARSQIAANDIDAARSTLVEARALARRLRRTREWLEARVLLALIAEPEQPETVSSWRESLSIAEANGYARLFSDAHPEALNRVGEHARRHDAHDVGASGAFVQRLLAKPATVVANASTRAPVKVIAPALLTAKEAAILELLAQGLSNKEIARAVDAGHETVKWHLKNLFGKLNAGSRRHAVDRARTLGLITP